MAKSRLVGSYPVIGIRPTIDGRRGALDVRGSLEDQTMNMAKSAAKLFEENLKYSNGEPVKVVIADTTIGRVGESAACADKFRKEGVDITMTFEGPDDEEDVESQINTLDAVIAENPSVVCLSAGDMDSCQAQLEAAKENGIPVVAFDSNVSDTKLVRAFRGTDNTQIGKYAAYKLGSAIGKMGNVAVFSAQEKTQSAQERVKGFLDNIANYTDIKVVETVYSDQVDDMKEAMKEVLDKYPALDGVFCTNAEVSEMFLEVNKDTGENKVAMVGVDATSKQQEAIQKGEELGVLSQNPYAMGYQTMWAAIQSTAPKKETKIDKKVLLDPVWIDAENIKSEDIANYLYN